MERVSTIALKDISNHLKGLGKKYTFSPWKLRSKETRRLNELLGISNINYIGNNNNKNQFKK